MAQIMGKNLAGINIYFTAKRFHFAPYIRAAYGSSAFGDEYRARGDATLHAIVQQLLLQIFDRQHRPCRRTVEHADAAAPQNLTAHTAAPVIPLPETAPVYAK